MSVQRLAVEPWMAIPVKIMEPFGELHFPAHALVVANVARAMLVRCAMAHQDVVIQARRLISTTHWLTTKRHSFR